MLKSNIFFLYPPGYSGNYLQWLINASEKNLKEKTIKNPLLPDGTTHGFVRKPTHIPLLTLLTWIIRNKPNHNQTYIVNCYENKKNYQYNSAEWAAELLLRASPNSLIINICCETDDQFKYGALNTYTKWPTFFLANTQFKNSFDPLGASKSLNSLDDRNYFYNNWKECFPINKNFNWELFNEFNEMSNFWYDARNKLQPHEVNENEYTVYRTLPKDKIINIKLDKITQPNFLTDLFIPLIENQNIGEFDWEIPKLFHGSYIKAQKNLEWFQAISNFRLRQEVDSFLLKNNLVQAFTLLEMKETLSKLQNWQSISTKEICKFLGYKIIE